MFQGSAYATGWRLPPIPTIPTIPAPHESGAHTGSGRRSFNFRACLPGRSGRCTVRVVIPLDNIFEDLKTLPPGRLEMAADFIRRLKPIGEVGWEAALARTFGCLSPEEADEMERMIELQEVIK